MDFKPLFVLALGIGVGAWGILPEWLLAWEDVAVQVVLAMLYTVVGIEVGREKKLRALMHDLGSRVITFPVAVVAGSVLGGGAAALLLGIPLNVGLACSAGCGYYSLTTALMKELATPEAAAIAFLSNLIREMAVIAAIPLWVRLFGPNGSVAVAGAAAMDTALPFIIKGAGKEMAMLALASGVVLTVIIPVSIPLLYGLF